MDVQMITQIISNVGFPIACCIYLLFANEKLRGTIEENTKAISEIRTMLTIYIQKEKGGN